MEREREREVEREREREELLRRAAPLGPSSKATAAKVSAHHRPIYSPSSVTARVGR